MAWMLGQCSEFSGYEPSSNTSSGESHDDFGDGNHRNKKRQACAPWFGSNPSEHMSSTLAVADNALERVEQWTDRNGQNQQHRKNWWSDEPLSKLAIEHP